MTKARGVWIGMYRLGDLTELGRVRASVGSETAVASYLMRLFIHVQLFCLIFVGICFIFFWYQFLVQVEPPVAAHRLRLALCRTARRKEFFQRKLGPVGQKVEFRSTDVISFSERRRAALQPRPLAPKTKADGEGAPRPRQ